MNPTAYGSSMTAMTVESAKNIGIAVAIGLIIVMVLMAWLIRNVLTKLICVLIVGGLAFGVWTQRSSLEDCAQKVKDRGALGDTSGATCSFLGADIDVPAAVGP
jgi:high-affinity Fe2+/Pb2+ permease